MQACEYYTNKKLTKFEIQVFRNSFHLRGIVFLPPPPIRFPSGHRGGYVGIPALRLGGHAVVA